MKRLLRLVGLAIKWALILVVSVEVLSFLAIVGSNFILYGHAREGSRAKYDPYTLFQMAGGVRQTAHNRVSDNPDLNRTIWMFGGSTMRSDSTSFDKTIASFVAEFLNAEVPSKRFRVINLGVNSFNSLMEVKYLQKAMIERPVAPDMVIFYDGANDAKYFAEHRTPEGHHGYRRVKALIESYYKSWFGLFKPLNAALYSSFTKELYDKIHQVAIPIEPGSPELEQLTATALRRYDYVNKVTHCYGGQFVLLWQPMLWVEQCSHEIPPSVKEREKGFILNADRYKVVRENFVTPYQAVEDKLKDKPYFVDLRNILCKRTVSVYQPDGVHLKDAGRRMVARRIADIIKGKLLTERE